MPMRAGRQRTCRLTESAAENGSQIGSRARRPLCSHRRHILVLAVHQQQQGALELGIGLWVGIQGQRRQLFPHTLCSTHQ